MKRKPVEVFLSTPGPAEGDHFRRMFEESRTELKPDLVYVSFLLGRVIDGRRRVEAVREFATEAEAKADAEQRLLMFGNAGWGRKTHDFGPGKDVVVDVMGRA